MIKADVKKASTLSKQLSLTQNRKHNEKIKTAIIYQLIDTSKKYTAQCREHDPNAYSILHFAIINDTKGEIGCTVLSQTPIVDNTDKFQRTPLFYAVYHHNTLLCEYLLINGANPTLVDYKKKSILHYAVQLNDYHFMKFVHSLATHYVNKKPLEYALQDDLLKCVDGSEICHRDCLMQMDALDSVWERADGIKKSISKEITHNNVMAQSNLINATDYLGRTALHLSAYYGNYNSAKALIDLGADASIKCILELKANELTDNPKVLTLFQEKKEIQINRKPLYNVTNEKDMHSQVKELEGIQSIDLIKQAIINDDINKFKDHLATLTQVDAIDSSGYSILHLVTIHHRYQMLQALNQYLKKSTQMFTNLYKLRTNNDLTALHICSTQNYNDMAELIIDAIKERQSVIKDTDILNYINLQCCKKQTALIKAVKSNHTQMMQLLLQNEADIYSIDYMRRSALHYAAINQNDQIIKQLIYMDADSNKLREFKDCKCKTADKYYTEPTGKLLFMHWWDYCANDIHNRYIIDAIKKKHNINAKTITKQNTGLHIAVENGALKNIKLLVHNNADPNIVNKQGMSAISMAKAKGKQYTQLFNIEPESMQFKPQQIQDHSKYKECIRSEEITNAIQSADADKDGYIDTNELNCLCIVIGAERALFNKCVELSNSNDIGRISIKKLLSWANS